MAYNKARAEKIWKRWKELEECELKRFNASEEVIEKLRNYDWEMFNAERRFRQREITSLISLDNIPAQPTPEDIKTVHDFLNYIEDGSLHNLLAKTDITTLKIVVMRINGYTLREAASYLNLSCKTVYRRMDRFKIKLKKFLIQRGI